MGSILFFLLFHSEIMLLILFFVLLLYFIYELVFPGYSRGKVCFGNNTLYPFIANTPLKRAVGLMLFRKIPKDGMLFVFGGSRNHSFWKAFVKRDLDLVGISEGRVISVKHLKGGSWDTVHIPGRFVLEIPYGSSSKLGLVEGAKVSVLFDSHI